MRATLYICGHIEMSTIALASGRVGACLRAIAVVLSSTRRPPMVPQRRHLYPMALYQRQATLDQAHHVVSTTHARRGPTANTQRLVLVWRDALTVLGGDGSNTTQRCGCKTDGAETPTDAGDAKVHERKCTQRHHEARRRLSTHQLSVATRSATAHVDTE